MSNYVDLNTLAEMDLALVSDLNTTASGSFYTENSRKMALNRSYRKCASLYRWPALEDSKTTTTGVNQDYYDAPTTWRPDSIWRLTVDGTPYGESPDYSPLMFSDYLNWKDDPSNSNSTEKKWSIQWLRYFIHPVPTVSTSTICIWGQKNVTPLDNSSDTTIFSSNMPDCNEAIVLEASAILRNKGDQVDTGQFFSVEAKLILSIAFTKIQQDSAKEEKLEPMWNTPDFFAGGSAQHPTGGFTWKPTN